MNTAADPFTAYVIFDFIRVVEIVLAFIAGAILSKFALSMVKRRTPRWRIYNVLALTCFCVTAAINGAQMMGDPASPRLFFNTAGMIFIILALRRRVTMTNSAADMDYKL